MKYICTSEQMHDFEKQCFTNGLQSQNIQSGGLQSRDIMYNAGCEMAKCIAAVADGKRTLVVCGQGNNGGDGFVAASRLAASGYDVGVCFVGNLETLTPDAAYYYKQCTHLLCELSNADIFLDALFGTGFKGEMTGEFAHAAAFMNACKKTGRYIFAADIPSGAPSEGAVQADETLFVHMPKVECACGAGGSFAGKLTVLNVGLPPMHTDTMLLEPCDLHSLLPFRNIRGHKGSFGSVGIVGGSVGMEGAALLGAEAALYSGAGRVSIVSALPFYENRNPCIMTVPSMQDVQALFDVLAFGMGAGRDAQTAETCALLLSMQVPLLLDADALFVLPEVWTGRHGSLMLTPHMGEAARLLGCSVQQIDAQPIAAALELSNKYTADVLLKSWYSIAVCKGKVYLLNNPTDALAKAGSGDVLAGIAAGLTAGGAANPLAGSMLVHNAAGHRAAAQYGRISTTAKELISSIRL